jgi:hypothetical protein
MQKRAIVAFALLACACFGESARDYYKELHDAGGLDQILSHYVCFDDRPELDTFFLFTESKVIRQVMIADGSFAKAPKSFQSELSKDLLFFRGYDKGVALMPEEPYHADNGSWLSERFMLEKNTPARMRFSITEETLRYKRSIETDREHDGRFLPLISTYGRCELVSHNIRQRGK